MRPLKLEIESLAVESFSASPAAAANADHARMSADCSVVCTFDWDCTA